MVMNYKFTRTDVEIDPDDRWANGEPYTIAQQIFESQYGSSSKQKSAKKLLARWRRHTRSRNGVEVFQLTFVRADNGQEESRFIIRAHGGSEAAENAERERRLAGQISRAAASDILSSKVIEGKFDAGGVVIYRHAEDSTDEALTPLAHVARKALASVGEPSAQRLVEGVEWFGERLTRAYNSLADQSVTWSGAHYHQLYAERLLPHVVIEAGARLEVDSAGQFLLGTEEGSVPGARTHIERLSPRELVTRVGSDAWASSGGWYIVELPIREIKIKQGLLCCHGGGVSLWLRTVPAFIDGHDLREESPRDLVFMGGDPAIRTLGAALKALGLGEGDYLHPDEFERVCRSIPGFKVVTRHNDLHSGNVLASTSAQKVIDIGDLDLDLLSADLARLETSLWYELGESVSCDGEVVGQLYERALPGSAPALPDVTPPCGTFLSLLSALHRGVARACPQGIPEIDRSVAYAAQVGLFQKYALRDQHPVPPATRAFFRFWIDRFRKSRDAAEEEEAKPAQEAQEALQGDLSPVDEEPPFVPTLDALWTAALTRKGTIRPLHGRVLEKLRSANQRRMNSPLTDLQQKVWDQCEENSPFASDQHVLLSAPTSSGKSTIAEMFLVLPSLLNKRRRCAVYVAPTRALAQAKWRELREAFRDVPEVLPGIVLSTGEDLRDDSRIARGKFTIACMVNEKANILFSRGKRLLSVLACVVIDELHMLMDIERGPVLELVMTKLLAERRALDSRERRDTETIRVVAITTEDRPDEAITELLSLDDQYYSDDRHVPLIFHSTVRPEPVSHSLVLHSTDQDSAWQVVPIVQFHRGEDRTLSAEQLRELDEALAHFAAEAQTLNATPMARTDELVKRVVDFVLEELTARPTDYRVLVFVPSKARVEEFARRIKNGRPGYQMEADEWNSLQEVLKNVEDRGQRKLIEDCAAAGVFVHHADIDQRARQFVEQHCEKPLQGRASEVIVATETLSYGINLAVADVFLAGVEFLSSDRLGEMRTEPLSNCAFHNMLGRAGRLGKREANTHPARAFIVLPRDARPYEEVVEPYYSRVDSLRSMLFVRDDMSPMRDADRFSPPQGDTDPCARYAALSATQFSNPFARSVLDALRHQRSDSARFQSQAEYASAANLQRFFEDTLFAQQLVRRKPRDRELFRCAMQRVLSDCSRPALGLVAQRGTDPVYYAITDLGESIIDTGTQIRTVEPVMEMVRKAWSAWGETHAGERFPTELYVLCLLAQEEVYTQYARYAPECRSAQMGQPWNPGMVDSNRAAVFKEFSTALTRVGITHADELAKRLCRDLEQLESLRKIPATYDQGTADAIIRLFTSIIFWIGGGDLEHALELVNTYEGPRQTARGGPIRGQMASLRTLTEQLSWKVRFVAQLLSSGAKRDASIEFDSQDERQLINLSPRLRFGCTGEAVALFWPRSSNLSRSEATRLLGANLLPTELLRGATWSDPASINNLEQLMKDLEEHAKRQFEELADELTIGGLTEEVRAQLLDLWSAAKDAFTQGIGSFRSASVEPFPFDKLLRERIAKIGASEDALRPGVRSGGGTGSFLPDPDYQVSFSSDRKAGAILWRSERKSGPGGKWNVEREITIQPLQCRATGDVAREGRWQPLGEVLADKGFTKHLVLVGCPWIPSWGGLDARSQNALFERARRPGYTTNWMTPAAFLVMFTALVREYTSGESFVALLDEPSAGNRISVLGVADVLRALDAGAFIPLPIPIRERLVEHFEVC
jgi:hypothetical protein